MSSTLLVCVPQSSVEFEPSCWGDFFVNVPTDKAKKVQMEREVGHLKEEVKNKLLVNNVEQTTTKRLELIDSIERLGLAYHFEEDIEQILDNLYPIFLKEHDKYNLFHVSLGFRIFRQHGANVPCDILKRFMTKKNLQDTICDDLEGVLSLYEACYVQIHEDGDVLEEILTCATSRLKSAVDNEEENMSRNLADQISHALHQPLCQGFTRLESKHYVTFYEQNPMHNQTLLRLAKLDFNVLLAMHHMELKEFTHWWRTLRAKLPFTRDRSVECYFWVLGCYYEPQHALARKIFCKMFMVVQVFDDIFDAYGTIEEKELLVEAVERWDYSCVDELPKYYKDCYIALLESCDEADEDLTKQGRSFVLHYWRKKMKENCKAWFKESKWCKSKYIPTYEEYIANAMISVGQSAAIVAAYLGMGDVASKEVFDWLTHDPMPKFIEASCINLRLMNDIAGHKFEQDREHVASAVECYMKQHGISDEEQVYVKLEEYVKDTWKVLNEGMLKPYAIPKTLMARVVHFAQVNMVMYKGRSDGYTSVNDIIKEKIASILIHPFPL